MNLGQTFGTILRVALARARRLALAGLVVVLILTGLVPGLAALGPAAAGAAPAPTIETTLLATNQNWSTCEWYGCTIALSHNATQSLILTIKSTPAGQLYGAAAAACFGYLPWASVACPVLAGEIVLFGRVLAWQLGQQDQGRGVIIYITYWHDWPGIVPQ